MFKIEKLERSQSTTSSFTKVRVESRNRPDTSSLLPLSQNQKKFEFAALTANDFASPLAAAFFYNAYFPGNLHDEEKCVG